MYRLYVNKGMHLTLMLKSDNMDEINNKIKEILDTTDISPSQIKVYGGISQLNPIQQLLDEFGYD